MNTQLFIQQYKVSMFWTEEEKLEEYRNAKLSAEAEQIIEEDCEHFIHLISLFYLDHLTEQCAHDFWLTRNHEGAGFWARPEVYGKELADRITNLVHKHFRRQSLYVGDDGLLYLA